MAILIGYLHNVKEWHIFHIGTRMILQTVFSLETIWIFALCNELIASYYHHIATLLEYQEVLDGHQLNCILKYLKTIEQSNNILYNGFSMTLMIASVLSVSITLVSSFYAIENFLARDFLFVIWDVVDVLDFFLRFSFICYSVDRVYSSGILLLC